ncbi:MAG: hypothetical protein ABII25_08080, partial [bacterium]
MIQDSRVTSKGNPAFFYAGSKKDMGEGRPNNINNLNPQDFSNKNNQEDGFLSVSDLQKPRVKPWMRIIALFLSFSLIISNVAWARSGSLDIPLLAKANIQNLKNLLPIDKIIEELSKLPFTQEEITELKTNPELLFQVYKQLSERFSPKASTNKSSLKGLFQGIINLLLPSASADDTVMWRLMRQLNGDPSTIAAEAVITQIKQSPVVIDLSAQERTNFMEFVARIYGIDTQVSDVENQATTAVLPTSEPFVAVLPVAPIRGKQGEFGIEENDDTVGDTDVSDGSIITNDNVLTQNQGVINDYLEVLTTYFYYCQDQRVVEAAEQIVADADTEVPVITVEPESVVYEDIAPANEDVLANSNNDDIVDNLVGVGASVSEVPISDDIGGYQQEYAGSQYDMVSQGYSPVLNTNSLFTIENTDSKKPIDIYNNIMPSNGPPASELPQKNDIVFDIVDTVNPANDQTTLFFYLNEVNNDCPEGSFGLNPDTVLNQITYTSISSRGPPTNDTVNDTLPISTSINPITTIFNVNDANCATYILEGLTPNGDLPVAANPLIDSDGMTTMDNLQENAGILGYDLDGFTGLNLENIADTLARDGVFIAHVTLADGRGHYIRVVDVNLETGAFTYISNGEEVKAIADTVTTDEGNISYRFTTEEGDTCYWQGTGLATRGSVKESEAGPRKLTNPEMKDIKAGAVGSNVNIVFTDAWGMDPGYTTSNWLDDYFSYEISINDMRYITAFIFIDGELYVVDFSCFFNELDNEGLQSRTDMGNLDLLLLMLRGIQEGTQADQSDLDYVKDFLVKQGINKEEGYILGQEFMWDRNYSRGKMVSIVERPHDFLQETYLLSGTPGEEEFKIDVCIWQSDFIAKTWKYVQFNNLGAIIDNKKLSFNIDYGPIVLALTARVSEHFNGEQFFPEDEANWPQEVKDLLTRSKLSRQITNMLSYLVYLGIEFAPEGKPFRRNVRWSSTSLGAIEQKGDVLWVAGGQTGIDNIDCYKVFVEELSDDPDVKNYNKIDLSLQRFANELPAMLAQVKEDFHPGFADFEETIKNMTISDFKAVIGYMLNNSEVIEFVNSEEEDEAWKEKQR